MLTSVLLTTTYFYRRFSAGNEKTGEVIDGVPTEPDAGDNGSLLFECDMKANSGRVCDVAKKLYTEVYQPLLHAYPQTSTTCQIYCSKQCNYGFYPSKVERFGG